MPRSKSKTTRLCVVVTVELNMDEWMQLYGEHIKEKMLVPEATVIQAVRKAVKDKMESLGIPSLKVDKPYSTLQKIDKAEHL